MKPADYVYWFSIQLPKDKEEGMRIGQSFCNFFNVTNQDLFYSDDFEKVDEFLKIWI